MTASPAIREQLIRSGGSVKLLEEVALLLDDLAAQWQDEARNFSGEAQKRAVCNMGAYARASAFVRRAEVVLRGEMT